MFLVSKYHGVSVGGTTIELWNLGLSNLSHNEFILFLIKYVVLIGSTVTSELLLVQPLGNGIPHSNR